MNSFVTKVTIITASIFVTELLHHEVVVGWLEPLLDRISRHSHTVACPAIDTLHDDTFQYVVAKKSGFPPVGGFSWYMQVGQSEHCCKDLPVFWNQMHGKEGCSLTASDLEHVYRLSTALYNTLFIIELFIGIYI